MKKTLIIILSAFTLASCEDLASLNEDTKNPAIVPASGLVANSLNELSNAMVSPNVNLNIFRLIAQYWTETTYIDESQYDLGTRAIPDNFWDEFYRDMLIDLAEARRLIEIENLDDPAPEVEKNQLAIISIIEAYCYSVLVNTYGNVPYTDALDIDNTQPMYDDAATVHAAMIDKLTAAITDLDVNAGAFGSYDLLFGESDNPTAHWKKFAASLKLRLGMIIADVDNAKAKAAVESAAPNVFQSNADNAAFQFLSAPPNTNPIWTNLVQSGRNDFVPTSTIIDEMNSLSDPRREFYFTLHEGAYVGGVYGTSNDFASYSHVSDMIIESDFEGLFMDYAEVEFLLAEAVERGFSVGGTAAGHYNAAITASMEYWGVSAADITAYLAQPTVNYATAPGSWKEKIGMQKWYALYNRGWIAWVEWRRFDYPELVAPPEAVSDIPLRYPYPAAEARLNPTGYNEAASAIGGDDVSTKLWWDIN